MKNTEEMLLSHHSLTVSRGGYLVNRDHIVIDQIEADNVADIIEYYVHGAKSSQLLYGRNIACYGMAALEPSPENPDCVQLASHATLINEGIIEIHLRHLADSYRDQLKNGPKDEHGRYSFVKSFGMAAGADSLLINAGTIRLYFDQGLESEDPVYGQALLAGERATVINNGTIELLGDGSFATQVRAIGCPSHNVNLVNNGKIYQQTMRASTSRLLATTGSGGSISNFGTIYVDTPGRIMTVARFSNTHLLNAGTIEVISRARYLVNKVSFLYQSNPLACAFYEHSVPNSTVVPPIINQGTIKVHLAGSEASTPDAVAFGIYSEMVGHEEQVHRFENTGRIEVTKSGPYDFVVAEVGCNVQSKEDFAYPIKIGEWRTAARDFSRTRDLFVCKSGRFDFSETSLMLEGEGPADTAHLACQTKEGKAAGHTFEVAHTEQMKIEK